jgi:CRISPR-associated endoribonuclease Cas6
LQIVDCKSEISNLKSEISNLNSKMPDISLLSLVLTLRPLHPLAEVPHLGRAAHALLLDAVRWADVELAERLHAGSEMRPFTASDVIGVTRKVGLLPERTYPLRLTALTAPVAGALLKTLTPSPSPVANGSDRRGERPPSGSPRQMESDLTGGEAAAPSPVENGGGSGWGLPLSPGSTIELGPARFRIEAIDFGSPMSNGELSQDPKSEIVNPKSEISNLKSQIHHPWAMSTTYEELSAPWLLGRETPARFIWMQFVSPTTFKVEGRHLPLPLPEQVFGSLLEKWNAFAPVAFPPETRRYAKECLALSSYELRSRGVMLKEGGLRMGAVGRARYVTTNFDRYWMSLINLLADFAIFAGAGAGTGMGLGQCRRIGDVRL